ncbi:MAG: phospholipid methyltransferase [Mariprofundus sp.]|nr:phospholipid methyltransferase [Mariprofundus sp.]
MASALPADTEVVVEFGGGTGPITSAMVDSGYLPENIYVFELSEPLCMHLKRKFPGLHVINASAADITSLECEVGVIISSLPLKSIPDLMVVDILEAARKKLQPGGYFVQFTYDLLKYNRLFNAGFHHISKKTVWANFPPARIDIFQKK